MVDKPDKYLNIILLGSPGSGKGTQARLLTKSYGFYHLATGDILREAMEKETTVGKRARRYIEKGRLVPDKLVSQLVEEKIKEIYGGNSSSILYDGYPRTVVQAKSLDKFLARLNQGIDAVIKLQLNADNVLKRLSGRLVCRNCGRAYNLHFKPPQQEGLCDACGGPLYQRSDDRGEVVLERLKIFQGETQPLIEFYKKRNLVHTISAEGSADEVFDQINQTIRSIKK